MGVGRNNVGGGKFESIENISVTELFNSIETYTYSRVVKLLNLYKFLQRLYYENNIKIHKNF